MRLPVAVGEAPAGPRLPAVERTDQTLKDGLARIRDREDTATLTVQETALERISVTEQHPALCRELRHRPRENSPCARRPAADLHNPWPGRARGSTTGPRRQNPRSRYGSKIMFTRIIITAAAAAAAAGLAGAPALASGTPPSSGGSVTVSAPVVAAETISLTGLSPTITFPTTTAGDTATVTGAENYTVTTTGVGSGFTLTLAPGGTQLNHGGYPPTTIPNSDLSVTETDNSPGTYTFSGGTPLTLADTSTTPESLTYMENWALAIPAGQLPGTYTEGFTYLALANS